MLTGKEFLGAIYNDGERLVPGETHDRVEIVRHKSSYLFFRKIIEADILAAPQMIARPIRILDIGCGVGHGTFMLTDIIGASVVGIDPSIESIQYAEANYAAGNVQFLNCDAETFVNTAPEFDYVVSRHALEHVEDGLNFALRVVCKKRLMVNVPFNESEGNVHHLVHWIKEEHFAAYPNKEFFYEGHDGVTATSRSDESPPNSIVCISSALDLSPAGQFFTFPLAAWQPEYLQDLGIAALEKNVDERAARIDEKESQLDNHHTNLRALEADIRRREAWLVEKESQLNSHHANLNALEADVSRRETWVADKELQLQNHEKNLEGIREVLLARESALQAGIADLSAREIDFSAREIDFSTREIDFSAREIDLAQQRANFEADREKFNHLLAVRLYRRLKALVG